MSEHTPGPWGLVEGDVDLYVYAAAPDALVAQVRSDDGLDCEANARLIAAAPELLAAVEAALGVWLNGEANSVGGRIAYENRLLAAITTATGEER